MPPLRTQDDALLLEYIVENLPDMVFVKDAEQLRFVRFNRAGEELLGWKRHQLIGKNDYDFFPKGEADFFTGKDREVLNGGRLVDIPEEPIHTAAHGLRWLHTKKIPIMDKKRRPLYLLGISRDITELRQARLDLQDREARLRLLLGQFPGLLWTADAELRLISVAGARACDLGLEKQVEGRPVAECLPSAEGGVSLEQLHRTALQGDTVSYEFRASGLDFEARLELLLLESAIRIVGVALDVTERRRLEAERLEAQLQRAQRLESLGVLAGGIAHDFNNLLVGILGNASLAIAKLPGDSPALRDLERVQTAAERASGLTRQMLAYSGKGRFVVEPIDVSAAVRETTELMQASISKQARLILDLAPGLPLIDADAAQLRQLVMNLLTNASDALEERPGTIRVVTRLLDADESFVRTHFPGDEVPPGRYVALEISDTGCGMDEHTSNRMFDPFFTTKPHGHGLGLAAALGIIRGHRGAIKVSSTPGRGTLVQVLMPALEKVPEVARPVPVATPVVASGAGVVLVIDDEDTVRGLVRAALIFAGFKVLIARDGEEGLALFRKHAPEVGLVLLDLTMPGLSGEATFHELRRIEPRVRVVLSSGFNEQEATASFLGQGLAGFLQKPYRVDELVAKVRQQMQGGRFEPS